MRYFHASEPPAGRPHTAPLTVEQLRAACWRGDEPAELLNLLDPGGLDHLVCDLWSQGWTDVEIATHTRMSTYTTARIRARLELAPHHQKAAAA